MPRARSLAALGVVLAAQTIVRIAWACSGPDALKRIEHAELVGWVLLVVSLAIVGAASFLLRNRDAPRFWLGALLVSHPGWWMSARGEDCGAIRTASAWTATVLMAVVSIVLVLRARRRG